MGDESERLETEAWSHEAKLWIDSKEETMTCICGRQQFYIDGSVVTCGGCGMSYGLLFDGESIEEPKEFNKRIREESVA